MTKGAKGKDGGVKQKLTYELQRFVMVFLYMFLLIGTFTVYRWLLLAEYHVGYFAFGFALIEALVLAKVTVVGESLGLGERFSDRPLIIPTLYKSMLFGLFVFAFSIFEHLITGFLHGQHPAEVFQEIFSKRGYEILSRVLIMFVAFMPFFAFRETGRVLGEIKLFELFFRNRAVVLPEN